MFVGVVRAAGEQGAAVGCAAVREGPERKGCCASGLELLLRGEARGDGLRRKHCGESPRSCRLVAESNRDCGEEAGWTVDQVR